MAGLHRRTGRPVRSVRAAIELTVVLAGWLLGGTVGVGTLILVGPVTIEKPTEEREATHPARALPISGPVM